VVKAGEKGPSIGDQVDDVHGREKQVRLVIDVAPGKEEDPTVPFDGWGSDPLVFVFCGQQGGGNPLERLGIRGWDKRPWVHTLFMQESPKQLVGPHGVKPLGTGITDAQVTLVAQAAALQDSVIRETAVKVVSDMPLDLLEGIWNRTVGEWRAHNSTETASRAELGKLSPDSLRISHSSFFGGPAASSGATFFPSVPGNTSGMRKRKHPLRKMRLARARKLSPFLKADRRNRTAHRMNRTQPDIWNLSSRFLLRIISLAS
jgi:hypothetical protein